MACDECGDCYYLSFVLNNKIPNSWMGTMRKCVVYSNGCCSAQIYVFACLVIKTRGSLVGGVVTPGFVRCLKCLLYSFSA